MAVDMVAIKPLKYRTRHLLPDQSFRVKSEREARVLVYAKKAVRAQNEDREVALDDAREEVGLKPLSPKSGDIAALRDEYFEVFGKRPFNGWSADTLKQRIAEA